MVKFAQKDAGDDEPERYNEVVGGKSLHDAFGERNGWLRGGFSINGKEYRNFESNSPENFVAQINARQAEHGVFAEIDENGMLRLSHQSASPILIRSGAGYQPPNKPGEKPADPAENTLLDDLGLDETTEENAAMDAQTRGNGLVGQVGDGAVVNPSTSFRPDPGRQFQTAEEIEATNRAIMSNPRGINPTGSRAPHAPHESVPGTTTTGNRPQPVPADSNAERVFVAPGQETALGAQPLRDGASSTGAAPQSDADRKAAKDAEEQRQKDAQARQEAQGNAQKAQREADEKRHREDREREEKAKQEREANEAQEKADRDRKEAQERERQNQQGGQGTGSPGTPPPAA